MLEQEARQNGSENTDDIEQEHEVLTIFRPESRGEQNVDRQASTAGHERSHQDRNNAVGSTIHRTGSHHGRNAAAEADEQRHEGLARKAESAHQAVHNERRASHVARVLKQREEEEEEEDDWNEGRDRLEAAADAVGQEDREPFRAADVRQEFREPVDHHAADQNVEEVNERAAQVLREQEHHVHDEKEDRQAEPAVKDNAVDLVGERRGSFADADNRLLGDVGHEVVASVGDGDIEVAVVFLVEVGNDLFDVGGIDVRKLFFKTRSAFHELAGEPGGTFNALLLEIFRNRSDRLGDLFVEFNGHRRDGRMFEEVDKGILDVVEAGFTAGNDADNRAAERFLKLFQTDFKTMLLGDVEHVDHDDHRHTHFDQLGREVEVALEVRGINNVDDRFSLTRQDVVTGDAFIFTGRGCRRNRIDAGKVDELDLFVAVFEITGLLVDRDAGPVAHALARTSQGIEKRGLAAVRIADHADDMLTHRL